MLMGIRRRVIVGLTLVSAIAPSVLAQKTGPPAGSGNAPSTSTTKAPPGISNRPDSTGTLAPSLYVTGNVVLDDGTPPPDPVTIERVCNGSPHAQGYTDNKGRFSFQIGQTLGVPQDASEESGSIPGTQQQASATSIASGTVFPPQMNAPEAHYENCELRAVLAGFRSDTISLAGRRRMDDPNVGSIVLHRTAKVEGAAISVTSLLAPKNARHAFEKARQHVRKNELPDAADQYLIAVKLYPQFAAAWYELGMIQGRIQDNDRAHESFLKAIAADPKFVNPYVPLIELSAIGGNWAELADLSGRLIKLDPVDFPSAYFYHATASLSLNHVDAAEKSAREGEKIDTAHRYPRIEQVLANVLVRRRDYAGAAEHFRAYLAIAPDADDVPGVKNKIAELERAIGANQQADATARKPAAPDGGPSGPP